MLLSGSRLGRSRLVRIVCCDELTILVVLVVVRVHTDLFIVVVLLMLLLLQLHVVVVSGQEVVVKMWRRNVVQEVRR